MVRLDPAERLLALDDAGGAVAVLRLDEVEERPRLVHLGSDVRRERRWHLALDGEAHRELHLLDRRDDALRLRHELGLAQPAGRLRRRNEPLRVLRAHVAVDPVLHRLGAELRDRIARIDALGAALVAEVAARAVPEAVRLGVLLESLDRGAVARVADEPHPLGERGRSEEVGVGLHRVALGHAAAAVDAERLLVDHLHLLARDDVLALLRLVVARLQVRVDGTHLLPERIHVDDEVLDDRQVAHRRDHGDAALLGDVVHPHLAGEHGATVHPHAAGAADHHPAALAVGERPVVLVLDEVEAVEQRRLLGCVDLVLLEGAVAGLRVVPPDLQAHLHQYVLSIGSHFVIRTSP